MKAFLVVLAFLGVLGSLLLRYDPEGWRPYRSSSPGEIRILIVEYGKRLATYESEHERLSLAPLAGDSVGKRDRDLLALSENVQAVQYTLQILTRERDLRNTLDQYHLGFLPIHELPLLLTGLSLTLLLLLFLKDRLGRRYAFLTLASAPEAPAREEYISEGDLPRRIETGFSSKKEALAWLQEDPGLVCEYCEGKMRIVTPGTVQKITFYKKVPEGVKDRKVDLGTYWYARPASFLTCPKCGKEFRR